MSSNTTSIQTAPGIRKFRARKLRPCDYCRSRRKRCEIPHHGAACTPCATRKRPCTFLFDREEARQQVKGSDIYARRMAQNDSLIQTGSTTGDLQRASGVNGDSPQEPLSAKTATMGVPLPAEDDWVGALLKMLGQPTAQATLDSAAVSRSGMETGPADTVQVALDDEANDEYELYLVGTASERDAINLNTLAFDAHHVAAPGPTPLGTRVRRVSPTTAFIAYDTQPYGADQELFGGVQALETLIGPEHLSLVFSRFWTIEAQALPIFQSSTAVELKGLVRCLALTAGLIYTSHLVHLHREAYLQTMRYFRSQPLRTRLWTIQFLMLDINGRKAINHSGNYIALGQAVSISRMIALHEDPTSWTIPFWEKELRINMWWALYSHDRLSALLFGRPSCLLRSSNVPLPTGDPVLPIPSKTSFALLCKLVRQLDFYISYSSSPEQLGDGTSSNLTDTNDVLLLASAKIDVWEREATSLGLFANTLPLAPGVLSLRLTFHGMRLLVARDQWDASVRAGSVGLSSSGPDMLCLDSAVSMVSMIDQLSSQDKAGYWSSHSSFILSSCFTVLLRLIMSWYFIPDMVNSRCYRPCSELKRYKGFTYALASADSRLILALSAGHEGGEWDVASLALSRARYFLPILATRVPELADLCETFKHFSNPNDALIDVLLSSFGDFDPMDIGTWLDGQSFI